MWDVKVNVEDGLLDYKGAKNVFHWFIGRAKTFMCFHVSLRPEDEWDVSEHFWLEVITN